MTHPAVERHWQAIWDRTRIFETDIRHARRPFWSHEVITTDPRFYRWTQWVFVQLFNAGLAVRRKA